MSRTKREFENPCRAERNRDNRSRIDAISNHFKEHKVIYLRWISTFNGITKKAIHEMLFPSGLQTVETTRNHMRIAGGNRNYLAWHIYSHADKSFSLIDISDELANKFILDRPQYILNRIESKITSKELDGYTQLIEPFELKPTRNVKANSTRHNRTRRPRSMHSDVNDYFRAVKDSNPSWYANNPEALYSVHTHDYELYLKSPLWQVIRETALHRDGYQCMVCRNAAEVVHHRNYETSTMYGMDMDSLISLCESCHNLIEFDALGTKRNSIEEKESILISLLNTGSGESPK